MPAAAAPNETPLATATAASQLPTVTQEPTATPTPDIEVSALQTQVADLQAQFVNLQTSNEQNREAILAQLADNEAQRQFEGTQVAILATVTTVPVLLEIERVKLAQMEQYNNLEAGRATQTAYVPTHVAAMRMVEWNKEYGDVANFIDMVGVYVALLVAIIAAFILLMTRIAYTPRAVEGEDEPQQVTTAPQEPQQALNLNLSTNTDTPYPSMQKVTIPATLDMVTEFAYYYLTGQRSTGKNHWEGHHTLWTRKTYSRFEAFCWRQKDEGGNAWATIGSKGEMVIPQGGALEQILQAVVDKRFADIPDKYELTHEDIENKEIDFMKPKLNLQILQGENQ